MRPEDQLDALLDHQLSGRTQRGAVSDELRPLMSAAARLDGFRDAAPADAFSRDLEARLLAHMAQATGAARPHSEQPVAPPRHPVAIRRNAIPLRTRVAWASIAAALLVTIGIGALTAKAAPGGPFYIVRQFAQTIAAHALPASSSVDTSALIDQLQADLTAFDQANKQGDMSAAMSALEKLRTDDQHASRLIATIADPKALAAARAQLASFHSAANGDLHASLSGFNLQGRAQITDLLRDWGYTSLVVTRVHISADGKSTSHDTRGSSGSPDTTDTSTLVVDAHGSGFGPGAQVIINGQSFSNVLVLTSAEISVRVPQSALGGGQVVIGVENSDGTVAFAATVQRDEPTGSGAAATPGPASKDSGHATPTTTESANP